MAQMWVTGKEEKSDVSSSLGSSPANLSQASSLLFTNCPASFLGSSQPDSLKFLVLRV